MPISGYITFVHTTLHPSKLSKDLELTYNSPTYLGPYCTMHITHAHIEILTINYYYNIAFVYRKTNERLQSKKQERWQSQPS